MPRRSFERIRGDLDLSRYLKSFDQLVQPWDSNACFDVPAPLELEIGSGKGLWLRSAASRSPDHNFMGIEVSLRYSTVTAAKLCKAGLTNAVAVCADAAKVLNELVPDNVFEAVHVYFPDPWWKKAHRKRRILRAEVLKLIEAKLIPGGTLHFWTDVEEYYLSTLELIAAETSFEGPFPVDHPFIADDMPDSESDITKFNTHFERRTILNDQPVYRSRFTKKQL